MIRTAILSTQVKFDDAVTTADRVADELTTLMNNATSTPNVLDKCGNPTFDDFQVTHDWAIGQEVVKHNRASPSTKENVADCIERVRDIVLRYEQIGETSKEGAVRDLITDIQHFCEANNIDFDKYLESAGEVFREEGGGNPDGKVRNPEGDSEKGKGSDSQG